MPATGSNLVKVQSAANGNKIDNFVCSASVDSGEVVHGKTNIARTIELPDVSKTSLNCGRASEDNSIYPSIVQSSSKPDILDLRRDKLGLVSGNTLEDMPLSTISKPILEPANRDESHDHEKTFANSLPDVRTAPSLASLRSSSVSIYSSVDRDDYTETVRCNSLGRSNSYKTQVDTSVLKRFSRQLCL